MKSIETTKKENRFGLSMSPKRFFLDALQKTFSRIFCFSIPLFSESIRLVVAERSQQRFSPFPRRARSRPSL